MRSTLGSTQGRQAKGEGLNRPRVVGWLLVAVVALWGAWVLAAMTGPSFYLHVIAAPE